MKESTFFKNDKTQDIRMMSDFKDELERIKQKLAKDFSKYSELEKMKNKQKISGKALIFRKKEENSEEKDIKQLKNDNYLKKVPSLDELNFKYGLKSFNKQKQEKDDEFESNDYIEKEKNDFSSNINNNKYKSNINNFTSINTHNINPLNFNISFRKKYIDISKDDDQEEDDDSNFSFTTDLNKKRNITSTNTQDATKIINNNINININNNSSLILDSKLDQQIKFIDETSENNRIQEEKTQKKIKQIENKLQLEERLTHNNREIRKNALKELIEMCQNDFKNSQDKQKMFEFFSPWIKYFLGETNSYVIPECLNFFIIFNSFFPGFLYVSMKDFFDNVERFISFGIYGINELCVKIFLMMLEDKKLYNQAFNEFMKLLIKTSSIKVYKFIQELILVILSKNLLQENYIKILFEKVIHIYININKNNDKKKIFSQLIQNIYFYIEDEYQEIKRNIKLPSYKELDSLFDKINSSNDKKSFITYTLYPRPIQTEIGNMNNYFNETLDLKDRMKTEESFDIYKLAYERRNIRKTPEKRNLGMINSKGEVIDLVSVLPNEFFEYHFEVQFQAKMQILEKANELLNKIKFVKDKEKNLVDIYKTINYSVEDSNILIHLEGIKLLENICRLINVYINKQKLKLLLETCFDKLKDKKSLVKSELFKLFNVVIEFNCMELSKFISFMLHHCLNEKNDNIKLGLLEFIKSIFFQENLKIQEQIDDISEKEYLYYAKKIVNIIEKESLSLIKDLCSDLLIIIKRKISSTKIFNNIISGLPNYRIKLIQNETKIEYNDSSYKRNSRRKISSYSLSNIKKGNFGNNISLLNMKSTNSSYRNDSFNSSNPTNMKKFKKINLYSAKNHRNNIKNINKKDNLNDKMNISFNNSPRLNRQIQKENDDYKYINKTEINEENNSDNNEKNPNIKNKDVNKESINLQKNNLIKGIDSIKEDAIEKYSKIIIKDFITFIKKTSIQKNEDLSPHLELIFIIYEKIFQRIFYFMNKNKNNKQNIIQLKKLMDELMNSISKILIITPGIQQIKGSTKFDIIKLEKYLSTFRAFSFNEEKYYMNLLLNLFKLCEGKDEDFPQNFEDKFSAIFFLNYVKKANKELNNKKIMNILKEFIAETNVLNIEEKNYLLDGIELKNFDFENEIKLNNQIKSEKKEENYNDNNSLDDSNSDESINENKNNLKLKTLNNEEKEKYRSKLKSYDFTAIEESIKLFSNSLKKIPIKGIGNRNQINKSNEEISNRNNSINRTNKIIDNNEIKKNMSDLNIPFSLLKNKLTLNNAKKLSLKLPTKTQNNHSHDKINKQNNSEKDDNNNSYNEILNQIIKALNNEIAKDGIFNTALIQFVKLSNSQKLDFVNSLQKHIQQNNTLLQNTSINILLNFYDYILSILSFQILKFPKEESLVITLQNFIQNLISLRNIDDMFQILLFLLKKYFPKDLNKKIEDMALVMVKIIAYFLKELLKKAKNQKMKGKNLICEINDIFINTPPSNLTTKTPNCGLYQNVFTLLKSITDEIAFQNKEKFIDIIQYLKEKQIICEEYVQYLIKLNKSLSK